MVNWDNVTVEGVVLIGTVQQISQKKGEIISIRSMELGVCCKVQFMLWKKTSKD
jgi:hypothetical protein